MDALKFKLFREQSSSDQLNVVLEQWGTSFDTDDNWKEEYKQLKKLKPYQIKLLDQGAESQSQAWLISQMWSDWQNLKKAIPDKSSIKSRPPQSEWETAFNEWKQVQNHHGSGQNTIK